MSDDRLWLRHKPSGRAILLAKWWTPRAATFHTAECMERWLCEVLGETYEQTLPSDLFDVVTESSGAEYRADWRCECGKEAGR